MTYKEFEKSQRQVEKLNQLLQPTLAEVQIAKHNLIFENTTDIFTPHMEYIQSTINAIKSDLVIANSIAKQYEQQISFIMPYVSTLFSYTNIDVINQNIKTIYKLVDESNDKEEKIDLVQQNSILMRNEVIRLIEEYNNHPDTPENEKIIFSEQPFSDNSKNFKYYFLLALDIIANFNQVILAVQNIQRLSDIEIIKTAIKNILNILKNFMQ